MATLPDLPTNDAGFVAYYNGLDNEADDVDPTAIISLGSIASYQQYDNGIRATYEVSREAIPNFFVNVRMKTDGWTVVWLDSGEEFYGFNVPSDGIEDSKVNSGDFLNEWAFDTPSRIGDKRVFNSVMSDLATEAFSGLNYSYDSGDVSIYHYDYTSSTAVNFIGFGGDGSYSYPGTIDREVEILNSATLQRGDVNDSASLGGGVVAENGQIASADLVTEGLTPDPNTNYPISINSFGIIGITAIFSQ